MHPIAFKIGNFPIYYYGLMMVASYILVLVLLPRLRKLGDLELDTALDITIYAIAGGVIGARLLYVLLNTGEYSNSILSIFNIREGGLSWHGALLGGYIGMMILSRIKKIPTGLLTDFAATITTLALSVGRIGCFLNGCCYGKPSHVPWAVDFSAAGIELHRHPTQLYESAMILISFFILLAWWKKKKFDGEITAVMFLTYGVIRFIVEIFRDNTADQYISSLPISLAQYLSIALVIICTAIILIKRKNSLPKEQKPDTEIPIETPDKTENS